MKTIISLGNVLSLPKNFKFAWPKVWRILCSFEKRFEEFYALSPGKFNRNTAKKLESFSDISKLFGQISKNQKYYKIEHSAQLYFYIFGLTSNFCLQRDADLDLLSGRVVRRRRPRPKDQTIATFQYFCRQQTGKPRGMSHRGRSSKVQVLSIK